MPSPNMSVDIKTGKPVFPGPSFQKEVERQKKLIEERKKGKNTMAKAFSDMHRNANDSVYYYRLVDEILVRNSKVLYAFKDTRSTLINPVQRVFANTVKDKLCMLQTSQNLDLIWIWPGKFESHAFNFTPDAITFLIAELKGSLPVETKREREQVIRQKVKAFEKELLDNLFDEEYEDED